MQPSKDLSKGEVNYMQSSLDRLIFLYAPFDPKFFKVNLFMIVFGLFDLYLIYYCIFGV